MVNVGQHAYTCHSISIGASCISIPFAHVANCTISQPWAILFDISKVN